MKTTQTLRMSDSDLVETSAATSTADRRALIAKKATFASKVIMKQCSANSSYDTKHL